MRGAALEQLGASQTPLIRRSGDTFSLKGRGLARSRTLSLDDYASHFSRLPETVQTAIQARWGAPEADPFVADGAFVLPVHRFGNVAIGIQPARGYNIDPKASYHDPDLVPPHAYFAFYIWLREEFWRRRARPHGQARQSRMAAGQGAGALGKLLSGGGARAAAGDLSVHRQRSGRGRAGEAAHALRSSSII